MRDFFAKQHVHFISWKMLGEKWVSIKETIVNNEIIQHTLFNKDIRGKLSNEIKYLLAEIVDLKMLCKVTLTKTSGES